LAELTSLAGARSWGAASAWIGWLTALFGNSISHRKWRAGSRTEGDRSSVQPLWPCSAWLAAALADSRSGCAASAWDRLLDCSVW